MCYRLSTTEDICRDGRRGDGLIGIVYIANVSNIDDVGNVSNISYIGNVYFTQVVETMVIPREERLAWSEWKPGLHRTENAPASTKATSAGA